MRVLLVDDRKIEREQLVRQIQRPDILVEVADAESAAKAIAREPPEALVLPGHVALREGYLDKLRSLDRSGSMYIVALLDSEGTRGVQEVLKAGAHDFARLPVLNGELRARVDPSRRLRPWMRAMTRQASLDWSRSLEIPDLHVWNFLGDIVVADLDQMFGRHVSVERGWTVGPVPALTYAATIPMSLPSARMEAQVSIVADYRALRWMGGCLLGDLNASEEMRLDVLRELANTAGGALKRAALPEQATLTTGLPVLETAAAWDVKEALRWTVSVEEEVTFCVQGRIARLRHTSLPASALREGMVVVGDLRADSGTLLLAAGTRLTSSSAERIRRILGPSMVVEVAHAQAA